MDPARSTLTPTATQTFDYTLGIQSRQTSQETLRPSLMLSIALTDTLISQSSNQDYSNFKKIMHLTWLQNIDGTCQRSDHLDKSQLQQACADIFLG